LTILLARANRFDVDANLFRRLEINHQLDLHRLFGREISRLGELADGVST
jgi:hypothetical protein